MHRWGIVPSWSKSLGSAGARYINARAETVATSPVFRTSFLRRRCIIPADGFYEWRREGKRKQPFLIHTPTDAPLAFAGLWAPWKDPASGRVAALGRGRHHGGERDRQRAAQPHARDPRRRSLAAVARPGRSRRGPAQSLLVPAADELLELRPASPLVNNANNEGAELLVAPDPQSLASTSRLSRSSARAIVCHGTHSVPFHQRCQRRPSRPRRKYIDPVRRPRR